MVLVCRTHPDARPVIEPQPALLRLLLWDLQPLSLPRPLDALVIDRPAGLAQKRSNAAIAIATILPCQLDHVGNETRLVLPAFGNMTLGRTMLTENATGAALRYAKPVAYKVDAESSARRA